LEFRVLRLGIEILRRCGNDGGEEKCGQQPARAS